VLFSPVTANQCNDQYYKEADMSVSIEVEKGKPFQIGAILPRAEKILKSILGLTNEPKITVNFVWNTKEDTSQPESAWIRPGMKEGFSAALCGEQAVAGVYAQEGVDYFVVSPERWQAVALGAAIAVVLAEHCGSEVRDTQSIYTLKEYMKPDEFLQAIKVDQIFDEINDATNYFFSRLPGAAKK
jgi:hypothetical protein